MKKVLIFSTAYFPFVGGAEVAVKEITDRITDDIQFDMITARMDRKLPAFERVGNINVYRMGIGLKTFDKLVLAEFGVLKALKLNKKNNYNCAWSIMASQASIAASLFKIFNKKIKLVLTLQEGDEEEHLARYVFNIKFLYKILIRPWHLLVFKKADRVTAISNYLKERAIKNGVKVPVGIIPNGFGKIEEPFNFKDEDKINYGHNITKGFYKDGDIRLVTTSRLVKKNAIDDVIKSLQYLDNNYKFLILGDGPDREKLENLAKKIGAIDRVKFEGHVFARGVIPFILKSSDVFIRPSLSEGLGNSFLEAMVVGLPVIATPVGGIPDFLKDGETGWFCGVKNPESIAEKVKYILDEKNKEEVERVKENAKKLVKEKYNWDNSAKKMENILTS